MIEKMYDKGIRSEHAYMAAIGSIGLSLGTWLLSWKKKTAGMDRADRWSIFIGQWAPTFFAMGNALRSYESK